MGVDCVFLVYIHKRQREHWEWLVSDPVVFCAQLISFLIAVLRNWPRIDEARISVVTDGHTTCCIRSVYAYTDIQVPAYWVWET